MTVSASWRAKVDLWVLKSTRRGRRIILAKAIDGRPLPIQLKPYGAVTARWAGAGRQDELPEYRRRDNQIRDCLVAPPGYLIVDIDLSQIEYRVLCALSGQSRQARSIATRPRRLFRSLPGELYGFPVSKNDDDPQKTARRRQFCPMVFSGPIWRA